MQTRLLIDGDVVCGRVVSATPSTTTFSTPSAKAMRFLVDGEPLQLGHTTTLTTIMVEPVDGLDDAVQRCLIFYGDVMGQVCPGQVVEATVKNVRGRLVVRQLNNVTTRSTVRPAFQVGGGGLPARIAALVLLAFLGCLLALLVCSIADGSLQSWAAGVFSSLADAALGVVIAAIPLVGVPLVAAYLLYKVVNPR